MLYTNTLVLLTFTAGLLLFRWFRLRLRMPPGPLGVPILGNTHQLPSQKPWIRFAEWNQRFGSVVSIFLGRTPVIILDSAYDAWALLEKRSEIYSSRPRFIMGGEILSANRRGLMLPYGDQWRRWRKILHSGFHSRRAESYKGFQTTESVILLHELSHNTTHFEKSLERFAASIVTSVTYGRRVDSVEEWIVKENMDAVKYLTSVNIPGQYLVESIPLLLRLPRSWQWFRWAAERRRQKDTEFLMYLFNDVKARMSDGSCPDCLTSEAISNMEQWNMSEIDVAYALSSPFGAGIETTAGTLTTFILAMLHFPDVARKAQSEIDMVVGNTRLPTFNDKESLPYVTALVNETLRWRPIAVLGGTPHAVTADDWYQGWFIPKGSTIFANFYGMMHNEDLFPEPDNFRPERFLESTNPRMKSFDLPFGFGRRQCPGMHLASNSLFIAVARILWAFDIKPALDRQGNPVLPDKNAFTSGFNSRPVTFDCRFVIRSPEAYSIIESEAAGLRLRD